jgi:hypothetical protein
MIAEQVTTVKKELLDSVKPYTFGSERFPTPPELKEIERLIRLLERENPHPVLKESFGYLEGLWKCLFTSSRYVLNLNKVPLVNLSAVYQQVFINQARNAGHYLNIAELSRGPVVKMACGEYAAIKPSGSEANRIEVQYNYFYFAIRLLFAYEGCGSLVSGLENNRLRHSIRLPFHKFGWQLTVYLDDDLRIVYGNNGGIFVLIKYSER